jgi:hypothetical protein
MQPPQLMLPTSLDLERSFPRKKHLVNPKSGEAAALSTVGIWLYQDAASFPIPAFAGRNSSVNAFPSEESW